MKRDPYFPLFMVVLCFGILLVTIQLFFFFLLDPNASNLFSPAPPPPIPKVSKP